MVKLEEKNLLGDLDKAHLKCQSHNDNPKDLDPS